MNPIQIPRPDNYRGPLGDGVLVDMGDLELRAVLYWPLRDAGLAVVDALVLKLHRPTV